MTLLAVAGAALILTQSSIAAPLRDALDARAPTSRVFAALAKLVTCPMCSGFWIGLAAGGVWSEHRWVSWAPSAVGWGFAGSFASAIGVALWLLLGEATAALSLWRYLRSPKDPPSQAGAAPAD